MDDVQARKLRPIYDSIESNNFKAALKLCTRKDLARNPVAKVLHAYCLMRLGRTQDALAEADAVLATSPTEEDVLKPLSLVYKQVGRSDAVLSMYERAAAAAPGDVNLAMALFFSYVRAGHTKQQQASAMRLYRAFPSPRFLLWNAASVMQQALAPDADARLRALAEMTFEKAFAQFEGRPHELPAEAVRAFIQLLVQQGKPEKALQVLDGPLGAAARQCLPPDVDPMSPEANGTGGAMSDSELLLLRAELHVRLGQWEAAAGQLRRLVAAEPDDWAAYCCLFDTEFAAVGAQQVCSDWLHGLAPATADESAALADATPAFHALRTVVTSALEAEDERGAHARRGPYWAACELYSRWALIAADEAEAAHRVRELLVPALLAYVRRFGSRACCFLDLQSVCGWFVPAGARGPHVAVVDWTSEFTGASPPDWGHAARHAARRADEASRAALVAQLQELAHEAEFTDGQHPLPALREATQRGASSELAADVAQAQREAKDRLQMLVTCHQLLFFVGELDAGDDDQLRSRARALVAQYEVTLPLNHGAQGGQREVQCGDELVLLAAHLLRLLYWRRATAAHAAGAEGAEAEAGAAWASGRRQALQPLWEAVLLLERALANSRYNFQFQLLLLQLHGALLSPRRALELVERLEIKHVQLDSLSYLAIDPMLACGEITVAGSMAADVTQFHRSNQWQVADHLAMAYEHANYSKISELLRFQVRTARSLQRLDSRALLPVLRIAASCGSAIGLPALLQEMAMGTGEVQDGLDEISAEEAADALENEDRRVVSKYTPPPADQPARGAARRAARLAEARLRALAARTLVAVTGGNAAAVAPRAAAMRQLADELEASLAAFWSLGAGCMPLTDDATSSYLLSALASRRHVRAYTTAVRAACDAADAFASVAAAAAGSASRWEEAAAALQRVGATVRSTCEQLIQDLMVDAGEGIVCPVTVASASRMLSEPLCWAAVALSAAGAAAGLKKRGKKGGKKRGKAAAQGGDGESARDAGETAIRETGASIRDAAGALRKAALQAAEHGGRGLAALTADDANEEARSVASSVQAGRQDACTRLAEAAKALQDALASVAP